MVGTLVGLHLRLAWRSLRSSPQRIVLVAAALVYLVGLQYGAWAVLVQLRSTSPELRGAATCAGFGLLTMWWLMATFVGTGGGQTLDPGRFALYPVTGRQLLPGQLAAAFLGLGGIWTVCAAAGYLVAWSQSPITLAAALVGAVLGCLGCVLLARVAALAFSSALASRRHQDLAALVLGVGSIAIGLVAQTMGRWAEQDALVESLHGTGRAMAWTPFGWAWALPWDAAAGRWGQFAVRALASVALVAGLLVAWRVFLDRALVSPLEGGGGGEKVTDHSVIDRLVPSTPAGAVAARSLRYWRRDPRHVVQFIAATCLPLLMAAPVVLDPASASAEDPLFYPVVGAMLMGSLVVQGEIGYDGTALWTQVVAGVSGRDDRTGRLLAIAWIFVPAMLVVDLVFLAVSGTWAQAPLLVGCSLAALLVAGAVGTVVGAFFQTPQPPPGGNAFSRPSGGGVAAVLWALLSMAASALLCTPFLVAMGLGDLGGWSLLVALAALLWGLGLLAIAVRWGGRILDGSWPEVLDRMRVEGN